MFPLHPVHLLQRRWEALNGLAVEMRTRDPQRALELRVTRRYVKAHGRYWYVFSVAALLLPTPRLRLFQRRLHRDARRATARELETLLSLGWREQAVGLWLIAAGRRVDLRNRLAEMAAGDEHHGLADIGPAAACLGEDQDAETLARYLHVALAQGDEDVQAYDGPMAMPPVAQPYVRDVPDLSPPEGKDLLQVLWCPFDHPIMPRTLLFWRSAAAVTDILDMQRLPAAPARLPRGARASAHRVDDVTRPQCAAGASQCGYSVTPGGREAQGGCLRPGIRERRRSSLPRPRRITPGRARPGELASR